MSEIEQQAAYITAPHMGGVCAIAVTDTSARTNLAAAAQLGDGVEEGRFITLCADGADVQCFLNNADAGTADPAATSGNDRTFVLKDGVEKSFVLRNAYTWFVARCATGESAIVRGYISSKPPTELG